MKIIGQGNVALDVSRILLKPISDLESTDIPQHVIETLSKSNVKEVTAVGRRGPGQVAFTTKEFREMLNLPRVGFGGVDKDLLDDGKRAVEGDRMRKRLLGLMETDPSKNDKSFRLDFLKSPKSFLPSATDPSTVGAVEWSLNALAPVSQLPFTQSTPGTLARPTGETKLESTDMVIESVGYRSEPLGSTEGGWKLPFDLVRGRIRNVSGRVVDDQGIGVGFFASTFYPSGISD